MGIPRIDTGPMTIDEFYAFTDARPPSLRVALALSDIYRDTGLA
jgi:hypothetical protein